MNIPLGSSAGNVGSVSVGANILYRYKSFGISEGYVREKTKRAIRISDNRYGRGRWYEHSDITIIEVLNATDTTTDTQ